MTNIERWNVMLNIDKACENFKEYLEKADEDGLAEESLVETV